MGYGATRRVEFSENFDLTQLKRRRRLRYQRVAGLFEDQITLTPVSAWLPQLQGKDVRQYEEVLDLFGKLLPEDTRLTQATDNGEVIFSQRGVDVPFSALSDGYRAYLGWIGDLLYHLVTVCPKDKNLIDLCGVVLLDEVDLHLHPSWQRTVIGQVSQALPNLQFILTSHSPIITGTLEAANIFVMETDDAGASQVRQLEENVFGRSAEEVLLSSYFDLHTTRAPDFEDELHEIAKRAWKGDKQAAVEYLKRLTQGDAES